MLVALWCLAENISLWPNISHNYKKVMSMSRVINIHNHLLFAWVVLSWLLAAVILNGAWVVLLIMLGFAYTAFPSCAAAPLWITVGKPGWWISMGRWLKLEFTESVSCWDWFKCIRSGRDAAGTWLGGWNWGCVYTDGLCSPGVGSGACILCISA